MKKKALMMGICVAVCFFMFAGNVFAEFYTCLVSKVLPYSDGQIRMQLLPGTGETRFTNMVRVAIDPADPGAKNMYATILTAISLGTEITVNCATVPTWDPIKKITTVGLVAP